MSETGKTALICFSVIGLLFVLPTAVAQESTEADMSDSMESDTASDIESDTASDMAAEEDVIELEEQVVIGSRARPRSVIDSAVPIDTIRGADLAKQGVTDLQDMFRNLVPSYNVNIQPISDAGTVVRPANLRAVPCCRKSLPRPMPLLMMISSILSPYIRQSHPEATFNPQKNWI